MASLNAVQIIGHLGRDPEVKYLQDNTAVANISVATSEEWKDKATGERKSAVEWHKVSFFGRLAEIVGEYLKKGSQVYVSGSLRTRKWQDKDGNEKYTTEIRADRMLMLDGAAGRGGDRTEPSRTSNPAPSAGRAAGNPPDFEDPDIPF
mgnify:CR=1 FL=1